MMKKPSWWVCVILLGFMSSASMLSLATAQTNAFAGDEGKVYRLDPASVRRQGNMVHFSATKIKPGKGTALEKRVVNCANKTIAMEEALFYATDGEVTGSLSYPTPDFQSVEWNVAFEALHRAVCKPESTSR